jgi:hypothetical protein
VKRVTHIDIISDWLKKPTTWLVVLSTNDRDSLLL